MLKIHTQRKIFNNMTDSAFAARVVRYKCDTYFIQSAIITIVHDTKNNHPDIPYQ